MNSDTVRQSVIDLDNKTGSKYDFNTHLPFPTLEQIYQDTGINLAELEGSTIRAQNKVRLFTNKAYRILVFGKIEKTNRDLEYLIATDLEFRQAFVQYVVNLIGDIFISGNNSILMSSEAESALQLRERARVYHSGIIDASQYITGYYEYRKGY